MIDNTTLNAFSDELEKISGLLGDVGRTAKKWVSSGWNKPSGLYEAATHEVPKMVKGAPVMHKGQKVLVRQKLKDEAGKQVWKERPDATWMGRGNNSVDGEAALPWNQRKGVTKYLPVGDKGILTGLTAASLPGALSQQDPHGLDRSRGERVSGLAGGTIGSLMGMGAMAHLPMKRFGIPRAIIGGIGGSIIGERVATAPHRALRKAEMPDQVVGGVA